jgi:hypothetical protein
MRACPHDLLRLARDYLESIGKSDELGGLRFFADDVIQVEFPNRLVPHGVTRDLAGLRDAAGRGSKVMTAQRFEVVNAIASGEQVAGGSNLDRYARSTDGHHPGGRTNARALCDLSHLP